MPENIGMVARAMDNCGINKLILVSPREKWPNEKAINTSTHAKNIIRNAKVFKTLNKALESFYYVIATTSRKRFLQKPVSNNFVNLFQDVPVSKKIAFVFGPENSGLSNDDLMLCDSIFNIKLFKTNESLNLSHAVLLIVYKWKEFFSNSTKFTNSDDIFSKIASKKDFQFFMDYLQKELYEIGFLYPEKKSKSMFHHIQTMFLRTNLSKTEIQTLWGMIKKLRSPTKNRRLWN